MTEFYIGQKVMFKPEHRNYSMGLGKTPGYQVFTVADVTPGIGASAKGSQLVTFTDGFGAYGFRLDPVDEVPVFKEPENKKLYLVLNDYEMCDLVDIHEAQEIANEDIAMGLKPMVFAVVSKTNITLELIK